MSTAPHGHSAHGADGAQAHGADGAQAHGADGADGDGTATVLVYSDDLHTRDRVRRAVGRRPSAGSPRISWVECATEPAVIERVRGGGLDLVILDGEAAPSGGMGVCLTLKEEIYRCPPVLVLTGRVTDNWLAAWSRADAAVAHPLDPLVLADAVAVLLRPDRQGTARVDPAFVPSPGLSDPADPDLR